MQISTFKLSYFELESGFFVPTQAPPFWFKGFYPKIIEYMQRFLQIGFSILY